MLKKSTTKILLLCLFLNFFSIFFTIPEKVFADTQFSSGYDITFVFNDNGTATVTHKITLTNLTKDYYATEYSLTTGSTKISNISGTDGLGSLSITTKPQPDATVLTAKLNQQVVGINKSVNFQISYTIDSLAIRRGNIWEINVPQIVTNENVSAYKLTISVPDSFGKLGKMSPTPSSSEKTAVGTNFIFTKDKLNVSGVGASFGDYQEFKFTLKFRYKNPNFTSAKATITLPPDTEYQALYYTALDPKPSEMSVDDSGNYLASYIVKGNSNLEVIASGYAQIVDADTPLQKPINWTDSALSKFTKNDRYIESDNVQIQKKAKELKNTQEIYDYVTTTLKYDFTRLQTDSLGRRGAIQALNKPSNSICTDFSDLFVALARAKGIPARGLVGFGYTDNTNLRPTKVEGLVNTTILHAWPEYYDKTKNRWIQVDPTWGSTTGGVDYFNRLDTNHFVFTINGTSSVSPLPAGAFKTSDAQTDDVKVEFSSDTLPLLSSPTFSLNSDQVVAGFPSLMRLSVNNTSGRAIFGSNISLKTAGNVLGLVKPESASLGTLLPFENRNVSVNLRSDSLLDNKTENLVISFSGSNLGKDVKATDKKEIKIKPFFSFQLEQVILIIILLIVSVSWIYPLVHRRRNRPS